MTRESNVKFATRSRIHLGLAVKELWSAVAFYRTLFGQEPTKMRPRYAKFEVAEPPVNLSLNEVGGETGPHNPTDHFGVQVQSTAAMQTVAERLARAGISTRVEERVSCCHAVQDKIWATDPDGNKWEVYLVIDDDVPLHGSPDSACCAEAPANMESTRHGGFTAAKMRSLDPGGTNQGCCSSATTA